MKPKLRHVVPALPDIAWRHHSPPFAEARESHHRAAGLHRVALKGREGKRIRELQDHLAVSGLAVIDQHGEAVRRKPYSVVLFDEVEKAHPDVFNILLQVLDDGRITDSQGRTVDFKNTILIMTSNIGSSYLLDGIDEQGNIRSEAESAVMNDLRGHFRPEFLNRLDEIILFKPLTKDNIGNIIHLMVADVNNRLEDRELSISLTKDAEQYIVEHGYDPVYGARPLKRYLQKNVETLAARIILSGEVHAQDVIEIDVGDGGLKAEVVHTPKKA